MLYPTLSKIKPFLILSVLLSVSAISYLYFARPNAAQSSGSEAAVLQEFSAWAEAYANAPRASELARGRVLAEKRSEILRRMVESDPRRVIDNSIDSEVLAKMPAEIAQRLERPVSFYGDFEVYIADLVDPVTRQPNDSRTDRFVVIGGERLPAVVYGRREAMTSKNNIPLRGVRVGDVIVLDEAPVNRIASADAAEQKVMAEVGGERREFTSDYELDRFVEEQVEWESKIGPDRGDAARPDFSWTEGPKTTLLIIVDFADKPGHPTTLSGTQLTETMARNMFSTQLGPFFAANSYGKTAVTLDAVTPVLRMPQTLAFYAQNPNPAPLLNDARAAARAAGFEPNNYAFDVVLLTQTFQIPWLGIAQRGNKGVLMNGTLDVLAFGHEMGHSYGLPHATSWTTNDGSILGSGSVVEYGDFYDTMGGYQNNITTQAHYNAYYKHRLDWLTNSDVKVANENGTYRIFAHDIAGAGVRGLKIPRNATSSYWVDFRQLFTNSPSSMNGATIRWEVLAPNGLRTTQLLDTTPLTAHPAFDHALQVGQSLTDDQNRIKITILGKGNTTPESLDVKVETNVGCTFDNVAASNQNFTASGGGGAITAVTQSGCRIAPTSNVDWIVPSIGHSGPAGYTVAANYDSQPRTGTLTFNGQTITVQQAAAATPCAPRPADMIAWWRGEGNELDQLGVLNGSLLAGSYGPGKVGGGLSNSVNGPAMEVPRSTLANLTQSMTIEGWVKLNSLAGSQRPIATTGPSYEILINTAGVLNFGIWYATGNGIEVANVTVGSDPIPVGQFVHFAGTLDHATGEMKIYINGQFVRQVVTTQRPASYPQGVAPNLGLMNGITDEISIYKRALSASEIAAIYTAGTAATGAAGKCLNEVSPFSSISGRVFSPTGQALRNVAVTLIDAAGSRRTVSTSSFGVYTFTNVAAGTNYTLSVSSKRYRFSPRTLDVSSNLTNIDFLGQE